MKWTQALALKLMRDFKDNRPCTDCGVPYRYWIMQFDHVAGKRHNLGTEGKKLDETTLRIEMARCDVVCGNCHLARTHRRQIQPRKK